MDRRRVKSCFCLLMFYSIYCAALPDDRQQILTVEADSADLNQTTHYGVYLGHVQLDQGSTHLRAAEATTEGNEKNQLTMAVAKGNKQTQAHFWTLTALDKPPLHAYADKIYYYPNEHRIELVGNARVEQGKNSFSAFKITYDTLRQHVLTTKNGDTGTTIIIYPEKQS